MKPHAMKSIALLLALTLSSSLALAQAKPAAQEPAKAAETAKAAEPVKSAESAKAAPKRAKPGMSATKSRRSEDARACLDKTSNNEIIKCAEEYL